MSQTQEYAPASLLAAYIPSALRRLFHYDCGDGTLAAILKRKNKREVWGMTRSNAQTGDARKQLDKMLPVVNPQHPVFSLPEAYFDGMIVENALEQTRRPAELLKICASALSDSGFLLLVVHNVQHQDAIFTLAEGGWHPQPGQLRFFTAYETARLLDKCGFDAKGYAPFERDPDDALFLDADGYARRGNLAIGPVAEGERNAWLTRRYVFFAQKKARR